MEQEAFEYVMNGAPLKRFMHGQLRLGITKIFRSAGLMLTEITARIIAGGQPTPSKHSIAEVQCFLNLEGSGRVFPSGQKNLVYHTKNFKSASIPDGMLRAH